MLVDKEIRKLAKRRSLITPFNENQLQPSSYDIRLCNKIKVINWDEIDSDTIIDVYEPHSNIWKDVSIADSYLLMPNECILGATEEVFKLPKNISARVEGKSSLGRMFLCNHITAGFIDPNFSGTITLEIKNNFNIPIRIYPHMLIGQIAFDKNRKCQNPYNGKYIGQQEPTESMYYKNEKII